LADRKGVTKIEALLAVLLIISIAMSGFSLMYISSLSNEISALSSKIMELAAIVSGINWTAPTPTANITLTNAWATFLGKPDPYLDTGAVSSLLRNNLYDFLVTYDESIPPKIVPALAESWSVSDDGMTYTFTLKRNVKFHSGNEFTAEDVKYSMDRMKTIKMGSAYLWDGIIEVGDTEVVDNYTVRFHLRTPFAPFVSTLYYLAILDSKLMKEHTKAVGPYGEFGDYGSDWLMEGHDAGCGPYQLTEYIAAEKLVMEKFSNYYRGWEENQIDRIVIYLIREEATHKLMMDEGLLTVSDISRSPVFYRDMKYSQTNYVVVDPGYAPWQIFFNVQKPPLNDVHLRRALAYVMDSVPWIRDVLLREVNVTSWIYNGPLPPNFPMSIHDQLFPYLMHNITAAMEELAQSSYNGEVLTFTYAGIEDQRLTALLFQACAAEIGVNIRVDLLPWAQYVDAVRHWETTPDIAMSYRLPEYLDPHAFLYGIYHSLEEGYAQWNRNPMHYSNPVVDELLERGMRSTNATERAEVYAEVQRILHSEVPCIFGINRNDQLALNRHFRVNLNGVPYRDFAFYYYRYVP
jgi:peptide/nickel transport system substrate-binding protein